MTENHGPLLNKFTQLEISLNFDAQKVILNIPSKGNYENFSLI